MSARTPEELKNPKLNYFIACKLGVDANNTNEITKAIANACGNAGGDLISRRLIELRSDIEETLLKDPNKKKIEAEAAKQFKLDEVMTIISSKVKSNGLIYRSELQDLCNTVNKTLKYFTFPELEDRFNKFNSNNAVKYIDNITNVIPLGEFDKVSDILATPPAKKDMYEFLGISNTASEAEIDNAQKTVYQEAQKKSDLKVKQTAASVCGLVKSILLKDKKTRQQYDYYVMLKDEVWSNFRLRKSYGAKDITLKEYYDFATIIQNRTKLPINEVEEMLGAGLKYYNLTVSGGDEADGVKNQLGIKHLEICPYDDCGKIYEVGSSVCPHCGRPLEVVCWNCGSKMPFTKKSQSCPSCQANYNNKKLFDQAAVTLDKELLAVSYNEANAQAAISTLRSCVPNPDMANTKVMDKISKAQKEIDKRKKEEETLGTAYKDELKIVNEAIAKKQYMRALSLATALKNKYLTYNAKLSDDLIADIKATLAKASSEINKARTFASSGRVSEAIKCAIASLDICIDYSDAKAFMAKYPPNAPSNLKVMVIDNSYVRIEWDPGKDNEGNTYTIIKKIGSAPTSVTDGELVINNLSLNFFDDNGVVSALQYYYGVFATRADINSALSKSMSPVVLFQEVSNVNQEMEPNIIKVSYSAPANAKSIEVYCSDNAVAPISKNNARAVQATLKGFTDTPNATTVGYLIIVNYENNGRTISSRGSKQVFNKFSALSSLTGVNITQISDTSFNITYNDNETGVPKLLFAPAKSSSVIIDVITKISEQAKMVQGMNTIAINKDSKGNRLFTLPIGSVGFIYPYIANDQLFVISEPIPVNTITGIDGLSYEETENSLIIKGSPNASSSRIIIKVSNSHYIENIEEDADDTYEGKPSDFTGQDGFKLPLKTNVSHYISIFSELVVGGKKIYSRPSRIDDVITPKVRQVVFFAIDHPGVVGKSCRLTVNFECDNEATIPPTTLRYNDRKLPLDKNSGDELTSFPAITLKKGLLGKKYKGSLSFNCPPLPLGAKFALFVKNDNGCYVKLRRQEKL